MDLATALIWMLRILLPVILFCIYFKLQSPKDEGSGASSGPTGHRYDRGLLLARRKATVDCPAPEAIADITLKTQEQAPALFGGGRGRAPRGGGDGGRSRGGGERSERGERGDRDSKRTEGGRRGDREAAPAAEEEAPAPEPVEVDSEKAEKEEQMNVACLLNYVAFNRRREQQRVFLPDVAAGAPPPPPPRTARSAEDPAGVSSEKAAEANQQVQMVLRGAMVFSRAEVSNLLYQQLVDEQVEISESTFALMIKACVLARELKFASDLLLKMETAGYCPESELLDKVMDLYSQQKAQRERDKKEQVDLADKDGLDPAEGLNALFQPEEMSSGMRAKLSSDAPCFVPSFGENDTAQSKLSTEAAPFVPISAPDGSADGGAAAPAEGERIPQRTKLKASSAKFEPTFGASSFDPSYAATYDPTYDPAYDPTLMGFDPTLSYWGGDWGGEAGWEMEEGDTTQDQGAKKGKGQGKEKAKGKGKDKAKDGSDGKGKAKGASDGKGKGKEGAKDAQKPKAKAKVKVKADSQAEGPSEKKEKDASAKAKWKAKADA